MSSQDSRLYQDQNSLPSYEMIVLEDSNSGNRPLAGGSSLNMRSDLETLPETSAFPKAPWKTRPTNANRKIPYYVFKKHVKAKSISHKKELLWTRVPQSFGDLVKLANEHWDMPQWTQIPHIMALPQFAGYHWEYENPNIWLSGDYRWLSQWHDHSLFHNIILASSRTGRLPLCAPDYFHYDRRARRRQLELMFAERSQISGRIWDLNTDSKRPEDHPDWAHFCWYVKQEVPTGEWLFTPKIWNKAWFARMIVEKDNLESRQEVVNIMRMEGHHLELPRKQWFSIGKLEWSQSDIKAIKTVAYKYWKEWREEAEWQIQSSYTNSFDIS